ncbi:MAG: hypothetical protein H7A51_11690 [Akkermansiaceae bacterium]|nr:hypothetical protein [Akkermansiaceae bacterium]
MHSTTPPGQHFSNSHIFLFSLCALLCLPGCRESEAKFTDTYYVSTDGDDQNPGTSLKQPFATIQRAVDIMEPGETCVIRGGVYRESVCFNGKSGAPGQPITLTSYKDEKVILDGTEKIDGAWSVDVGNVYKTTTQQDITQLFVDGKLMTLARFPNALAFSDEVWHRTAARCHRSRETRNERGGGHVVDGGHGEKAIAHAGYSFNGCVALMNFGAHATGTRIVENHQAGSAEFDYRPELMKFKTTLGYFFEGGVGNAERRMLDTAQEWAFDETNQTLYLWADNGESPEGRGVYGKTRTFAITGDAASQHIVVDGLNFFATTFSFNNSDHITIKNCDFKYYACSKRALGVLGPSETASFTGTEDDFCSHITVYNCTFRYADASAITGDFVEDILIENNLFTYIDYACANNDNGMGKPFDPSSTLNFDKVADLTYRRNTLSVCGNAQGFSANRYQKRNIKRFSVSNYDPTAIRPIVCEWNFHTRCGLLHTDGSSMYIPDEHMMESVVRYNWLINNGQRDLRWDGANKPLTGVHGNLYRNVAMSGNLKKMSPSGGNGFRVKGSYHEVYHNLGINRGSELNIATEKGGNAETITRNNAASMLTDQPVPGISSNNYGDKRKSERRLKDMLRDPVNWDFRPRADAVELIDKAVPVTCSIKGVSVPVNAGFTGGAPDIGTYEYGADSYWIPGRQDAKASMPVPKMAAEGVPVDADLMYLSGLGGVRARIHLGTKRENLVLVSTKNNPQNIVSLTGEHALQKETTYFWRVDTEQPGGAVVMGDVWSFTTAAGGQAPAAKVPGKHNGKNKTRE